MSLDFLILAEIDDYTAIQVYNQLRAKRAYRVKLASAQELVLAGDWQHRLQEGAVKSTILLQDGTCLYSEKIGIVLNRFRNLTMPHFQTASEEDREYAVMEMHALVLSWLFSLPCPIVNPVSPRGLGAQHRSIVTWSGLARKAGLPVRDMCISTNPRRFSETLWVSHAIDTNRLYSMSPMPVNQYQAGNQPILYMEPMDEQTGRVLIIGDQVMGGAGNIYANELRKLAAMVSCNVLEVRFGSTLEGQEKVISVSSFPEIIDEYELNKLTSYLEQNRAGGLS